MLAAAVQLVRISPDNNALELCEESLNELIKLNQRPLAVVGPAGTARAVAGGEFVLDDLQHLCKAMPSSSASLSEGLWLWPRTMKISGQEDNLVSKDSNALRKTPTVWLTHTCCNPDYVSLWTIIA